MQNHVIQHLAEVLLRQKSRSGSWSRLADDIHVANDRDPDRRIDRRTLERLCGDESAGVQLKISQALALDHWLETKDEGSLLAKERSLVDSIRESYNVNFLVAAKYLPEMQTDVISRWDLRATTRLMRTPLNRLQVSIWDITGPENWRDYDTRIINAANISIGSPVAAYASQVLMSKMIGISPNEPVRLDSLPFFIIGAERDSALDRSFVRPRSEWAETPYSDQLPKDPDKRALVVDGRWYESNDQHDYALLLAQRNPDNGHVQMVLCGLTGQGTYQLARIIQAGLPAETMPELRPGQDCPPIFLVIYKLTLGPSEEKEPHTEHPVVNYAAIDSPRFIHYVDGEWQFLE